MLWVDSTRRLHSLDGDRHALAHTDTHRCQRQVPSGFLQLMRRGQHQPRSAHSERMAQSDGSAVWIDMRRVVRNSQLPQACQHLAGERFIQLDYLEVTDT